MRARTPVGWSRPHHVAAGVVQQLLSSCSVFSRIERGIGEELLQYEAMTGLNDGQLTDLVARLHGPCG